MADTIQVSKDFALTKPSIDTAKILSKEEQTQVESILKSQGRKLIHRELKPAKNDYQHDYDRGTVEYSPKCRNYSYHKVIIPDGTRISGSNFTQKEPNTDAIAGKNLEFSECTLINVLIDPSWVLKGCNTSQVKNVIIDERIDGDKTLLTVSLQVLGKDMQFAEVERHEEIHKTDESIYLKKWFNVASEVG